MTRARVRTVHLVRHALPVELSGTIDPDPWLSGFGLEQARAIARWWSGRPVSGVVTSQLLRARQTAGPLLETVPADPAVEPGVAEFELGADFYLPVTDLSAAADHPGILWWRSQIRDPAVIGARQEFADRAVDAFAEITAVEGEEPLLVFTHGGFIAAVTGWILGLPGPAALDADFASITTLRRRPSGGWTVASFSETQHLAALGEPRQSAGISLER